jgi:uncharacterized membrane protein YphA (DoxX/SURF4 family)
VLTWPAFRLDGKGLDWYAAWKQHSSLYPLSAATARALADELRGLEISGKGTIRFRLEAPLPPALVRRFVEGRVRNRAARKPRGEGHTMNITLWALQVALAVAFLAHGWMFLFPPADLVDVMNATIPPAFRLFLGVAEIAAAIGLTLPALTRIKPWLVSCAAAGLMIVMTGATILHVARGEHSSAVTTTVLFVALAFVGYMRWKVAPVPGRSA